MLRTLMYAPGTTPGGGAGGDIAGSLPTAQVMRIAKELGIEAGDEATLLSRLKDAISVGKTATTQMADLLKRVGELEAKTSEQEFETICSNSKRISPAQKPGMLTIFKADRRAFDELLKTLPEIGGSDTSVFAGDKTITDGKKDGAGHNGRTYTPDFVAARDKKRT